MSKTTISKTAIALATVSVLAPSAMVQAEEATKPTDTQPTTVQPTSTSETTSTTTSTSATVTPMEAAQNEVDTTSTILNTVTSEAQPILDAESAAQNEYNNAVSEQTQASETLDANQLTYDETVAEITTRENNIPVLEKNIQIIETVVSQAQSEEVASSEAVSTANNEVKSEEAKIQPQVDDLNAKSETLSEKEVAQSNAQTSATQAAKELAEAESDLATAESDLIKLEDTLDSKADALEKAKVADQTRAENIESAQTEVNKIAAENQELSDEIAKTTSEVATYKENVTAAQKAIVENFDLTFSDEFLNAYKKYKAELLTNTTEQNKANSSQVRDAGSAWLDSINITETKEMLRDSDSRPVDWYNLTQDQLDELTVFAAQLIEDFRTQMGTYGENQLAVTVETNKLAKLIADVFKEKIQESVGSETPGMWDAYEVGHVPANQTITPENLVKSGVMKSADGRVPNTSRSEALAYESVANAKYLGLDKTMGGMKAQVFGAIVGLIADDAASGWAHTSILANDSNRDKTTDRTQLELLFIRDGDYLLIGIDETRFDYSVFTGINKENISLTPIDVPKTDSSKAKQDLAEAQTFLNEATARLNTLNEELEKASPEFKAAQDALAKAQAVPTQTEKAQMAYDTAEKAVQSKEQEINDLKSKLPALEQAVTETNQKLADSNTELKVAQDAYNESKANYDEVSQGLEAAKAKAATLQKAYEDSIVKSDNADKHLEAARKALIDNENEIKRLKALLPIMIDKITEAKETLAAAEAKVIETKAIYEAIKKDADAVREDIEKAQKDYDEALAHLNSLKAEQARKEEEQKAHEAQQQALAIIKATQARFKQEEQARLASVNSSINSESAKTNALYDSSSDNLPETGSESNMALILMGMMSILSGLFVFRKKEQD